MSWIALCTKTTMEIREFFEDICIVFAKIRWMWGRFCPTSADRSQFIRMSVSFSRTSAHRSQIIHKSGSLSASLLRNSINSRHGTPNTKKENIYKMDTGRHTSIPTGTPDGNEYYPPCRLAEVFITTCPQCGREMRLKTLRYTHKRGRSFDPVQRACEQQVAAEKAINDRMTLLERLAERKAEQAVDKHHKYIHLIQF
jgi:hypothetical protein